MSNEEFYVVLNTTNGHVLCKKVSTVIPDAHVHDPNAINLVELDAIDLLDNMNKNEKRVVETIHTCKFWEYDENTKINKSGTQYTTLQPFYIKMPRGHLIIETLDISSPDKNPQYNNLLPEFIFPFTRAEYLCQLEVVPLSMLMKVVYGVLHRNELEVELYLIECRDNFSYRYYKCKYNDIADSRPRYFMTKFPEDVSRLIDINAIIYPADVEADWDNPKPFLVYQLFNALTKNRNRYYLHLFTEAKEN